MNLWVLKAIVSLPYVGRWLQQQGRAPSKNNILGWVAQNMMAKVNSEPSVEIVKQPLDLVNPDIPEKSLLAMEWGPGNGFSIQAYLETQKCSHIYAVEISDRFRDCLAEKFPKEIEDGLVSVHSNDARNLDFLKDSEIDVFSALNVLYFLNPLNVYIRELRRVCKPGARVVFGVSDAAKQNSNDSFVNTDWDVCTETLKKAGFEDVRMESSDIGGLAINYISATAGPK